jgi:DNA-directed RNA polymerase subunit RPC12/RpoP
MKEQIEEMAKELCGMNIACKDCRLDKLCLARNSADILYNAGYRKQIEGEWKWISDDDCICSACGKVFYTADNADAGFWNFCPDCGAKMKGDKNEQRAD